MNLTDDEVLKF